MKRPYLITGGCGFLGSNVAARLLGRGDHVVLFDNHSRIGSAKNLRWLQGIGPVDFIFGDVTDRPALEAVVKKTHPAAVFHLAGQVAMTTSVQNPFEDFRTNVLGTIYLLETLRTIWPETILVYSSSNKVYGKLMGIDLAEKETRFEAVGYPEGFDESFSLDFRTPYGCSKGAADQYVLEYSRTYGMRTVVFRHSTIYGAGQYSTYDQGWVGWFCLQAYTQKSNPQAEPFTISGNGKQVRDLLYINDAVDCYLEAVKKISSTSGEVFNIGGGIKNSSSILELIITLQQKMKTELSYSNIPWRHEDQKFFVANCTKFEKATKWSPKITKEEGVERILKQIAQDNKLA